MNIKPKLVPPQEYIERLRVYIEKRYGSELRSALLRDVDFFPPNAEDAVKVDIFRFYQHFPYKESLEPYLDLFINPVSNRVIIHICDGTSYTQELEPNITLKEVEVFFAALVLNAEKSKEGVLVPTKKVQVH